ncbi:MAG: hypothetical protein IKD45_04450 [Clostridia bacterium]|nr:hypothetical protein [Clostridia bacterium]
MKNTKYESPNLTVISVEASDIITTSAAIGTETPIYTGGEAIWDLNIN